jgi:hypothetical protein
VDILGDVIVARRTSQLVSAPATMDIRALRCGRASLSRDGEFTMLKKLSICAALSFLLVSSAMAQSRVCAADIKQACANIEPGGGRIAACVKEKFNNLNS